MLTSLTAQTLARTQFEVIVSGSGSADGTYEVCCRFRSELRLRYRYQEDLGFRAAARTRIAESHNGPSPVGIIVRSVTHSRFGASAVKFLITASPASTSSEQPWSKVLS